MIYYQVNMLQSIRNYLSLLSEIKGVLTIETFAPTIQLLFDDHPIAEAEEEEEEEERFK